MPRQRQRARSAMVWVRRGTLENWSSVQDARRQARNPMRPDLASWPVQPSCRSGGLRGDGSRQAGATPSWPEEPLQSAPARTAKSGRCLVCAASWSRTYSKQGVPVRRPANRLRPGRSLAMSSYITLREPGFLLRINPGNGSCKNPCRTGILLPERFSPPPRSISGLFLCTLHRDASMRFPIHFPALVPRFDSSFAGGDCHAPPLSAGISFCQSAAQNASELKRPDTNEVR